MGHHGLGIGDAQGVEKGAIGDFTGKPDVFWVDDRREGAHEQPSPMRRRAGNMARFGLGAASHVLLVAGFSNRANLSVSAVVTDFLMIATEAGKIQFLCGAKWREPAMAVDSDEIEFRAVPAICLAASYRREPRPGTETRLAYSLQLHFTIALSGVSVERTADRKRSRRSCRNSLHAHL